MIITAIKPIDNLNNIQKALLVMAASILSTTCMVMVLFNYNTYCGCFYSPVLDAIFASILLSLCFLVFSVITFAYFFIKRFIYKRRT